MQRERRNRHLPCLKRDAMKRPCRRSRSRLMPRRKALQHSPFSRRFSRPRDSRKQAHTKYRPFNPRNPRRTHNRFSRMRTRRKKALPCSPPVRLPRAFCRRKIGSGFARSYANTGAARARNRPVVHRARRPRAVIARRRRHRRPRLRVRLRHARSRRSDASHRAAAAEPPEAAARVRCGIADDRSTRTRLRHRRTGLRRAPCRNRSTDRAAPAGIQGAVPVTVVGASAGPVITRFQVEPALGVRGSQIVGLMKDLSRGLGLTSIRARSRRSPARPAWVSNCRTRSAR